MSFVDGKPRIATEEDLKRRWSGDPKNFRCYLCGHKFQVGDRWRFLYMNSDDTTGAFNALICGACDGPDVIARWKSQYARIRQIAWWAFRG